MNERKKSPYKSRRLRRPGTRNEIRKVNRILAESLGWGRRVLCLLLLLRFLDVDRLLLTTRGHLEVVQPGDRRRLSLTRTPLLRIEYLTRTRRIRLSFDSRLHQAARRSLGEVVLDGLMGVVVEMRDGLAEPCDDFRQVEVGVDESVEIFWPLDGRRVLVETHHALLAVEDLLLDVVETADALGKSNARHQLPKESKASHASRVRLGLRSLETNVVVEESSQQRVEIWIKRRELVDELEKKVADLRVGASMANGT